MSEEMKNLRASETALGVIPIAAETKSQAQLRSEWERRLAPLGLALNEETPPDDMWYRIRSLLDRADDRKALAITKRGVSRWRWFALLLGAVSAGLIAFIVTDGFGSKASNGTKATFRSSTTGQAIVDASGSQPEGQVVAVATPDGSKQALILELDPGSESAIVRPVGVTVEEGRDLEIWRISSQDAPISLGLVTPGRETVVSLKLSAGDTIAVTSEPKGGSTIGTPSGPTVLSAPLIEIPE